MAPSLLVAVRLASPIFRSAINGLDELGGWYSQASYGHFAGARHRKTCSGISVSKRYFENLRIYKTAQYKERVEAEFRSLDLRP